MSQQLFLSLLASVEVVRELLAFGQRPLIRIDNFVRRLTLTIVRRASGVEGEAERLEVTLLPQLTAAVGQKYLALARVVLVLVGVEASADDAFLKAHLEIVSSVPIVDLAETALVETCHLQSESITYDPNSVSQKILEKIGEKVTISTIFILQDILQLVSDFQFVSEFSG